MFLIRSTQANADPATPELLPVSDSSAYTLYFNRIYLYLKGWLTVFFSSRLDCVYGVQSNMC